MKGTIHPISGNEQNAAKLREYLDNGDALSADGRMNKVYKDTLDYNQMRETVDVALFLHFQERARLFEVLEDKRGVAFAKARINDILKRRGESGSSKLERLSREKEYEKLRMAVISYHNEEVSKQDGVCLAMNHGLKHNALKLFLSPPHKPTVYKAPVREAKTSIL